MYGGLAVLALANPAKATRFGRQDPRHRRVPGVQVAVDHRIRRPGEHEQVAEGVGISAQLGNRMAHRIVDRPQAGAFEAEQVPVTYEGIREIRSRGGREPFAAAPETSAQHATHQVVDCGR